jgi:hypothetical protein
MQRLTGDGKRFHRKAAGPDLSPAASRDSKHRGDYPRGLLRLADGTAAAAAELLALASPVCCACCGAEDLVLCGPCARQIRLLTRHPFRAEARAPVLMDMDGSVLLPVVAAGVYRDELAQAVLSFKRHGQALQSCPSAAQEIQPVRDVRRARAGRPPYRRRPAEVGGIAEGGSMAEGGSPRGARSHAEGGFCGTAPGR